MLTGPESACGRVFGPSGAIRGRRERASPYFRFIFASIAKARPHASWHSALGIRHLRSFFYRGASCYRRLLLAGLPCSLARRFRVHDRYVDAEGRAELARLHADRLDLLPRLRRLPRPGAHPPVHAHRRRHRRPTRSAPAPYRIAVRADDVRLHPRRARLLGRRTRLAHPDAVVRHWARRRRSAGRPTSRSSRRSCERSTCRTPSRSTLFSSTLRA